MDDDLGQPTFIKKRTKSVRPSGSTSSLRSLSLEDHPSSVAGDSAAPPADDDEGNVAIIRNRGKKGALGRVKAEAGVKPKSRLSFGGDGEEEDSDTSFSRPSTPRKFLRGAPLPVASPQPSPSTSASVYSKDYLAQLKSSTLSTPPPPRPSASQGEYDDLTLSKFGSRAKDDDEDPMIPTSTAIASAKEKRERMRKEGGGTGGDYVSLEVDVIRPGKNGESRLVREEDELGDGDEEMAEFTGAQEKVALGKKANKEAAARLRKGMEEMIDDAEEDAEQDGWEEEQIRRGEGRKTDRDREERGKVYRAAPIPASSTVPTLSAISTRLAGNLTTLKSSHKLDSSALEHFVKEREDLDAQEAELRAEVVNVSKKKAWFEDFKDWTETVAGFLDEKFPALLDIEKTNLSIQKERYTIISKRRYEDDSDDVSLFTGSSVPTAYPTPPDPSAEDAPALAPKSGHRESRRLARTERIAARPKAEEDESLFTDSELSAGENADLSAAAEGMREALVGIFADVKADEFRDPELGVKKKFEEWRQLWPDEYGNAFGGLAMVGVWEFWARVEMSLWNPFDTPGLTKPPPGLDSYQWHRSLSSFAHSDIEGEENDEAETVVNALVTTVVVPRLEVFAKEVYDPLSRRETAKALSAIDEVSYSVERASPRFESLILAFLSRLQHHITLSQSLIAPHLSAIALPSNAFDPTTFAALAARVIKLMPADSMPPALVRRLQGEK
ncbi:GC-rich sequence DNA-binding factor [Pseudohyphozyma bogoriensis]|nr:GC-rich sequence DNA-binding factor [Pseudohyphozyma bogoriensis]